MANVSAITNQIYTISAVGTVFIGILALVYGVQIEVVEPIVLSGALVVGIINIYWLFRGSGAY
ncbi:hypothetical protein [Haloarcula sp. CGMCC 1.6347]|uniref:hypothetical protein n=1 Tax=Haloarcula sp. CGMCC 1.6347 TaxID=3111455 RepID=UPI00300EA429